MATPKVILLAALDRDFAIGRNGQLPWHLPDDLARFKALTLGKTVLMGRKTALSIGRELPGRHNLILTRSAQAPFPRQQAVISLDHALQIAEAELIVVGGAEVYRLAMPIADAMHLTHVHTTIPDADTWFPRYNAEKWRETARTHHPNDSRHAYAFDLVDYIQSAN